MSFLVRLANWFCPNYFKDAKVTNSVQVITIGLSHYCEFACWALKLANINFQERAYSPGQHVFPALAVRVGTGKKYLSTSSRAKQGKEANQNFEAMSEEEKKKAKKRDISARSTAVPVAVKPDGTVLLDSWEIASYGLGNNIDPELKTIIDEEIGPLSRQRVYSILLQQRNHDLLNKLCLTGRGWLFSFLWKIYLGGFVLKSLQKMFGGNEEKVKQDLLKTLPKIDKFLDKRQGEFINGDKISLGDVALASLFAPLVSPPLYSEGKYNHIFNELMERDEEARKEIEFWRNTKVGQYTLGIYSKYR